MSKKEDEKNEWYLVGLLILTVSIAAFVSYNAGYHYGVDHLIARNQRDHKIKRCADSIKLSDDYDLNTEVCRRIYEAQ